MKHFQISQIKGKYQIFNHRCLNQTKKSNNGGELLFALMNPLPQTFCSTVIDLIPVVYPNPRQKKYGEFHSRFCEEYEEVVTFAAVKIEFLNFLLLNNLITLNLLQKMW